MLCGASRMAWLHAAPAHVSRAVIFAFRPPARRSFFSEKLAYVPSYHFNAHTTLYPTVRSAAQRVDRLALGACAPAACALGGAHSARLPIPIAWHLAVREYSLVPAAAGRTACGQVRVCELQPILQVLAGDRQRMADDSGGGPQQVLGSVVFSRPKELRVL